MKKTTKHTDQKMEDFLQKVKAHAISAFITFFSAFSSIFVMYMAEVDFENIEVKALAFAVWAGVETAFRGAWKILFQSFLPKK